MNDANIVSAHTEGNWKTHLGLGDVLIPVFLVNLGFRNFNLID